MNCSPPISALARLASPFKSASKFKKCAPECPAQEQQQAQQQTQLQQQDGTGDGPVRHQSQTRHQERDGECNGPVQIQQQVREQNQPNADDALLVDAAMAAAESSEQPQERARTEASSGVGALKCPRDQISQDTDAAVDAVMTSSALEAAASRGLGGQVSELSADEEANLIFIREEEKLARDVYLTLAAEWDAPIFGNIAQSEQSHMDAVGQLLDKYGIDDPIVDDTVGVFADPFLQDLYNKLVSDSVLVEFDYLDEGGLASELAGFRVGAFIEEYDILDIQHAIGQTTHNDIKNVYENLLRGSKNHLRSFVAQIESATDEDYEPVLMTDALYQDIISGEQETANGRRNGR